MYLYVYTYLPFLPPFLDYFYPNNFFLQIYLSIFDIHQR
jgi:hypothetical protein